ncbi:hypothetical protein QBC46DRAFT_407130 [Diplogelasinospora grovesii]|uniref:Uncharacterized protein n=1 Tax=Diplogelasinospora grovesii TaxID=303347 RepID=A0AAN6S6H6_9PEZI|nr:hypothetical protein QBC46DRAFT_407130 [Diplogelasinospora grovesii]
MAIISQGSEGWGDMRTLLKPEIEAPEICGDAEPRTAIALRSNLAGFRSEAALRFPVGAELSDVRGYGCRKTTQFHAWNGLAYAKFGGLCVVAATARRCDPDKHMEYLKIGVSHLNRVFLGLACLSATRHNDVLGWR